MPQPEPFSAASGTERDWTPEEYAWSCVEDMRGWALRAEEAACELREQNFALRREIAELRGVRVLVADPDVRADGIYRSESRRRVQLAIWLWRLRLHRLSLRVTRNMA